MVLKYERQKWNNTYIKWVNIGEGNEITIRNFKNQKAHICVTCSTNSFSKVGSNRRSSYYKSCPMVTAEKIKH